MVQKISRRTATIFMLINVVCWGAALPIVKYGLGYTTPFRYLLYRYSVVVLLTIPVLVWYWPRVRNKLKTIPLIVVLELLGTTVALAALYTGLSQTTALNTNLLSMAMPFFIIIGGMIFLREKQEKHEWLGMLCAFLGTLILVVLPVIGTTPQGAGSMAGNAWIMVQNLAAAAYFLAKRHYGKLPKLFVVVISSYVGLLSFALLSWIQVGWSIVSLQQSIMADLTHHQVWLIAFYMAIFGTLIGLTAYIRAQDGMEASEASLFGYLQPLVYIPLSVFLLMEPLTAYHGVAFVLIVAGEYLAQRRVPPTKKAK